MGLDIYVGPFTRYFAHDWKSSVEQAANALGIPFTRWTQEGPSPGAILDPGEVHAGVLEWRSDLEERLHGSVPPLVWDESPTGDYFTDKPDHDGYWALFFLAAHDEFPDVPAPKRIPPAFEMTDPTAERLYRRVADTYPFIRRQPTVAERLMRRSRSRQFPERARYPHLLVSQIWLPVDFERPFIAVDGSARWMAFGSVQGLARELDMLNGRTLRGDADDLQRWRANDPRDDGDSVESIARYGLTSFLAAARYGVEHRMPMRLDP